VLGRSEEAKKRAPTSLSTPTKGKRGGGGGEEFVVISKNEEGKRRNKEKGGGKQGARFVCALRRGGRGKGLR